MKLSQFFAWLVCFLGLVLVGSVVGSIVSVPWELNTGTRPLFYEGPRSARVFPDSYPPSVGPTWIFSGVPTTNEKQYAASAHNTAGAWSGGPFKKADNIPPTIMAQPQDQTVSKGGFVSFSVTVTGTEPLTYLWLHNGANIPGGTSSTLTLNNVQTNDAGQYAVVVSNDTGSAQSSPATLTVFFPSEPPTILVPPQNQTANPGGFVSFSVTATDTRPLTYQWLKDGVNIGGATSDTLNLNNVQTTDAGQYTVIVSNPDQSISSSPATLQIILSPRPIFESLQWIQAAGFSMALRGQAQISYRVQISTNLVDWLDLTNFTAAGVLTLISDPEATNSQRRFYRAVALKSSLTP